jgi:hypothetical protein
MKRWAKWGLRALLLFSALVGTVAAADESFSYQFLGSPLLVLVVLLVIDAIALLYHRIRK